MLPGGVAQAAGEAGWLALLLALPIALALCWVLFQLLLPLPPGTGLAEACPLVLGKTGGKLVLALCLLWGLLQLSVTVRMCAQRFLITGYRNRPVIFYIVVLLAAALWIARGKLAALGRAGEVFHAILAVTLGVVLLLAAFRMKPENLFPIWVEDLPDAGAAVVPVLSLFGYAVPGAFLAGGLKRQDMIDRYFTGTVSRVGGITLEDIEDNVEKLHSEAFDPLGLATDLATTSASSPPNAVCRTTGKTKSPPKSFSVV